MPRYSLRSVLDWLRAGYPEGIPPKDHFALLSVLRRRLTDEDISEILDLSIATAHEHPQRHVDYDTLREIIAGVLHEEPTEADLERVTEQLVSGAGRWSPGTTRPSTTRIPSARHATITPPNRAELIGDASSSPRFDHRMVARRISGRRTRTGLRAAVGTPETQLSDDEVDQVADTLIEEGDLPVSKTDIAVLITKITNEMPLARDIDRVRVHLEAGGWPLMGHDQ